jgi:phage shock protein PspC (stress-responsive transcriptional regulator)
MVSGVSGGLAAYFGTDPALVRVLWVIAAIFTGGLVLVAYLVLWIVVPEEGFSGSGSQIMRHNVSQMSTEARRAADEVREAVRGEPAEPLSTEPVAEPSVVERSDPEPLHGEVIQPYAVTQEHQQRRTTWAAVILITLGVLFLASNFGLFRWFNWGLYWPLILVAVGIVILLTRLRG